MTMDVNQPTDQALISSLPGFIRADRAAINAITALGGIGNTTILIGAGVISLTVGTDLSNEGLETVRVTGAAAIVLQTILGGTNGQVKILIFQDANVQLLDGLAADGKFYLNHLPALTNYVSANNSVLALINIGGDGVAPGYWKELWRTDPVK